MSALLAELVSRLDDPLGDGAPHPGRAGVDVGLVGPPELVDDLVVELGLQTHELGFADQLVVADRAEPRVAERLLDARTRDHRA